jgi:hypothetical protein
MMSFVPISLHSRRRARSKGLAGSANLAFVLCLARNTCAIRATPDSNLRRPTVALLGTTTLALWHPPRSIIEAPLFLLFLEKFFRVNLKLRKKRGENGEGINRVSSTSYFL